MYNNYGVWDQMPNELYVIGDIHGDFFALKQSLELTGCVEFEPYNPPFKDNYYLEDGCLYYSKKKGSVKWKENKKNCFIVFTGDIVDRCRPNIISNKDCINTVSDENCDLLLLKLLYDLDEQAKTHESKVIVILGNHEIMNIQNDSRYVSLKGRHEKRMDDIHEYLKYRVLNIYGIIRIEKYIIVHGGINNNFFSTFNSKYNINLFESIEIFNCKLRDFILSNDASFINDNFNQSPFWDRTLGGNDYLNDNQCKEIFENNVLKIRNFDTIKNKMKILVAHCPQFAVNQTINLVDCQTYKNRIWRIDVGMSRAFDLYDMDKIKMLKNIDPELFYLENFFIINEQTKNRAVSCIKLTKNNEEILKGKLTIEYFYDQKIFKTNKIKLLHILSDLIKIFIDNFKKNKNYKILLHIIKLKKMVKNLSK